MILAPAVCETPLAERYSQNSGDISPHKTVRKHFPWRMGRALGLTAECDSLAKSKPRGMDQPSHSDTDAVESGRRGGEKTHVQDVGDGKQGGTVSCCLRTALRNRGVPTLVLIIRESLEDAPFCLNGTKTSLGLGRVHHRMRSRTLSPALRLALGVRKQLVLASPTFPCLSPRTLMVNRTDTRLSSRSRTTGMAPHTMRSTSQRH